MSEPETQKVKAIDVKPYYWALWCTIEGGGEEPFENEICGRKWSDDGKTIWFMLDSHNFLQARPEEELELVPIVPRYPEASWFKERMEQDDREFSKTPPLCPTCGK